MLTNEKLLEVFRFSLEDSVKNNTKSAFWTKHTSAKIYDSEENLINFRKKQLLSHRLDDSANVPFEPDLIESLKTFEPNFLKKNLPLKNVGNCENAVNLLGHYYDWNQFYPLGWYNEISKYIDKSKVVCEIGQGYGNFARIIINNNINTKFILIDLPEQNLLTSYYLKENFPDKRFYLYDNYKKDNSLKKLDDFDIFILPPWCEIDKSIKIDFFINSRSMMEFKRDTIKKYFDLIERNISSDGYFLNINRDRKSVIREENNKQDIFYFYEFPYDKYWDVIISKPSFRQPLMQFMLTQRKHENIKNNVKDEFIKLKKIYLKRKYYTRSHEGIGGSVIRSFMYKLKEKSYIVIKKLLNLIFRNKIKNIARIIYGMSKK